MTVPIRSIRARIEGRDKAEVDEDADQQHPTIDADAFDVCAVMIRRANPRPGLGDDAISHQIAVCGGGTKGKPRKFARLANLALHVPIV